MLKKMPDLTHGRNVMTQMQQLHPEMLMDSAVQHMVQGETVTFGEPGKETALLLLDGAITFLWEGQTRDAQRASLFDENPSCLHVPVGVTAQITARTDADVLVLSTTNDTRFDAQFHAPEDVDTAIFGDGVWGGTARRAVRTVFDYSTKPASNLVVGEVLTLPGRWSSYVPHHHPQPEVYYYRFDKPQGFGACFIGEDTYKITDNSFAAIPGGLTHPQTSAPGYAMYYCWIIRHLPGDPWTTRINDAAHEWLLGENPPIWQPSV